MAPVPGEWGSRGARRALLSALGWDCGGGERAAPGLALRGSAPLPLAPLPAMDVSPRGGGRGARAGCV